MCINDFGDGTNQTEMFVAGFIHFWLDGVFYDFLFML